MGAEDDEKAKAEQEKSQRLAEEADRMTVRCSPLGEDGFQNVETTRSATVLQLAHRIAQVMGMRLDGGLLRVIHNGQEPLGSSTLRAANIDEGAEIYYYVEGR